MRDMDVAFVTTNLDVKGSTRRIVELSNHLVERGHTVTIYTKDAEPCGWLPLRTPVRSRDEIGQHEALICCGGGKRGHQLLRESDVRLKAVYVLGIGSNLAALRQRFIGSLGRNATSFVRLVNEGIGLIANCTAIAECFQDQGYECGIVHGGVDFETFYPRVGKDSLRVLWAGTRRLKTGTADALAMMKIIRETAPKLYSISYAYRDLPQDTLAEVYSSAMCFLDAHYAGGWNNPVAEAMACGTAVVCTDIDGVQDFAFHEETALLVEPRDVEAMARSVLLLASSPRLRARLRRNALDCISEFTWDCAVGQLEEWLGERL